MGKETIQVSGVIHASPERIYQAWLDSEEHTRFTGGKASVESGIGGRFTAWDGYIEGTTIELEPGRRIVQAWRTTEFPSERPDSRVERRTSGQSGSEQPRSGLPGSRKRRAAAK